MAYLPHLLPFFVSSVLHGKMWFEFVVFALDRSSLSPFLHGENVAFFYFFTTFWKGFVGNFGDCSVETCTGFFQEKWVSPMINSSGLSGFTQQIYTHFFGKCVALTHSTYCLTLYTLAKMCMFTS